MPLQLAKPSFDLNTTIWFPIYFFRKCIRMFILISYVSSVVLYATEIVNSIPNLGHSTKAAFQGTVRPTSTGKMRRPVYACPKPSLAQYFYPRTNLKYACKHTPMVRDCVLWQHKDVYEHKRCSNRKFHHEASSSPF